MEIEKMTTRFNTAQGVVFAVAAGIVTWVGTIAAFLAVAS